jgi:hypothetical protein
VSRWSEQGFRQASPNGNLVVIPLHGRNSQAPVNAQR